MHILIFLEEEKNTLVFIVKLQIGQGDVKHNKLKQINSMESNLVW